jgi:hypothetical protein
MDDDELLTPPELARILKGPLSWGYARTRRRRGKRLPPTNQRRDSCESFTYTE